MDTVSVIRDEFEQLLNSAKDTAMADGIISNDEAALLQYLEKHLDQLAEEVLAVVGYLKEDISESDLRQRVRLLARDSVPKLTDLAKQDGQISSEEASILSNVLNRIM